MKAPITQNSKLKTMPLSEAKGQNSYTSLDPIAQAAAELGIEDGDEAVLEYLARAVEGLV